MNKLTENDIKIGKTYRAKKPREAVFSNDKDDRTVLWIGRSYIYDRSAKRKRTCLCVQYDSPFLSIGRHFPKTTMHAFLNWASHEIGNAVIIKNTLTGIHVSHARGK